LCAMGGLAPVGELGMGSLMDRNSENEG